MMFETIDQLYLAAVERFVHSVVVVDDRARLSPEEHDDIPETLDDPRPAVTTPPAEMNGEASTPEESIAIEEASAGEADENRLDAAGLIEGFANRGMVCAALKPEGAATGVETLVAKAATRCDIVTLDWHLVQPDDGGAKALAILDEISSGRDTRLGLVAVYTGDPHVDEIVDKIAGLDGVARLDRFALQRGGTRITVLSKEGTRLLTEGSAEIVPVADLPERLLLEFSRLAAGLLPAATMSALGALRESFHEVIGVLAVEHDHAFVGQRMAQNDPDDATDHLIDLVVSELRSVIEGDDATADAIGRDAVDLWLAARPDSELAVSRAALSALNASGGSRDVTRQVAQDHEEYKPFRNRHPTALTLNGDEAASDLANARFAERMSVQHPYQGRPVRRLELGVVLKDDTERYWVCIQPLCDSVRLATATCRMPLLPFELVAADSKKFNLVLSSADEMRHLQLEQHPSAVSVFEFEVDTAKAAVMPVEGAGEWHFSIIDGPPFTYCGRLKRDHAQRLAQNFGNAASRVGLNESEWLRLKARGGDT